MDGSGVSLSRRPAALRASHSAPCLILRRRCDWGQAAPKPSARNPTPTTTAGPSELHWGLYSYGLYSYGLYSYGPCSYGPYSYGLYTSGPYSYGPYSYGLYSYGPYRYGPYSYGHTVMAFLRNQTRSGARQLAELPARVHAQLFGISGL